VRHTNRTIRGAIQAARDIVPNCKAYLATETKEETNEREANELRWIEFITEYEPTELCLTGVAESPAAAAKMTTVRRWMADTGCCYDLISHKELSGDDLTRVRKAKQPCKLKTANGEAVATKSHSNMPL
jgi:hypothetical protein